MMDTFDVNNIGYPYPRLFLYKDDVLIVNINNDIEMFQVRLEIAQKQLEGYTIKYGEQLIPVDKKGNLAHWPTELYKEGMILFQELRAAQEYAGTVVVEPRTKHLYYKHIGAQAVVYDIQKWERLKNENKVSPKLGIAFYCKSLRHKIWESSEDPFTCPSFNATHVAWYAN